MAFVFEFMSPSHAVLRIRLRAMVRSWKNMRPEPKLKARMKRRDTLAPWQVELNTRLKCAKDLDDLLSEEDFPMD